MMKQRYALLGLGHYPLPDFTLAMAMRLAEACVCPAQKPLWLCVQFLDGGGHIQLRPPLLLLTPIAHYYCSLLLLLLLL